MKIFKGKDGEYCMAKISYAFVLFVFTIIIAYKETNSLVVDYSGMSIFLAAVAGTYFARSHTKAKGVL